MGYVDGRRACVQGVVLQGTPSKVVLLRNMVAPGEVDEHLEDEIAEELGNFGGVQRVLIFEVTDAGFDPKQAVRLALCPRVSNAVLDVVSAAKNGAPEAIRGKSFLWLGVRTVP
jgi:hypothetical protein